MAMNLTTALVETAAPDQTSITMIIAIALFVWLIHETLYKKEYKLIAAIMYLVLSASTFYVLNSQLAITCIIITSIIVIKEGADKLGK